MIHELKTWPEFFEAILNGNKTFEVRKDDRGFKVGDILHLREWDHEKREYTGRELARTVTYILKTWTGIEPGYCVMSLVDQAELRLWQPGDEPYEPDYWGAHYE